MNVDENIETEQFLQSKEINLQKTSSPTVLTGNVIRKKRMRLCLTKVAFAKQVGVSVQTISTWESMGRKKINAQAISIKKLRDYNE